MAAVKLQSADIGGRVLDMNQELMTGAGWDQTQKKEALVCCTGGLKDITTVCRACLSQMLAPTHLACKEYANICNPP